MELVEHAGPRAKASHNLPTLTGYTLFEQMYAGDRAIVYRGRRDRDRCWVAVKLFRQRQPDGPTIARYQREFELARKVGAIAGVIQVHALVRSHDVFALVMEDGGSSLRETIRSERMALERTLGIAVRVATTLGRLHDTGMVHGDMSPANVVVRHASLDATLIDFGLSFELAKDRNPALANDQTEGTLHYMAPEQTGRINRPVDHRADLYAFGATLYEMLTGRPPFLGADAVELIHAHIAKRPIEPHVVDPAIPVVVSHIVMKLLAKDPDQRYQSGFGLAADLERCLAAWRVTASIPEFEIGRHDVRHRLVIPTTMYGRQKSLALLLAGLDVVATGGKRLQLVGGAAGVGKTRLVHALERPTVERGGYYASGKFEQLRQDRPYSAIVAAFRHIVAALLAEDTARIAEWRRRIADALGDEAGLVLPLIPELGVLLDREVPAMGAISSRETARVPRLIARMITTIAAPDHPLVLVLDDLQWADAASLHLIETVMKSQEANGLYVIGLYRDNEVTAAHPLLLTRHAIELEGLAAPIMILDPLTVNDVEQLLIETLQSGATAVQPLAEVVQQKTVGNPFFVRAFLDDLEDAKLVEFDPEARHWSWDVPAIRQRKVTDNVVDLLVRKIGRLDADVRTTLQSAACLGAEFELDMLSLATQTATTALVATLSEAVETGLVVPCEGAGSHAGTYRFVHDRVEQAVYALIPVGERTGLHQLIGRRLLAALSPEQRAGRVFDLLYHLNHGMDATPRPEPVPELGALNLLAGKKAKASAAYSTACRHLSLAIELLPRDAWTADYATTLELHDEAVEAAFLNGDLVAMQSLLEVIQKHAKSVLDVVKAYLVRTAALIAQHRQNEAIDKTIEVLDQLGMKIPRHPTQLQIMRLLGWTLLRLRLRPVQSLLELPRMTDPTRLAMTNMLIEVLATAYQASQHLFVVMVLRLANMTLSDGTSDGTPTAFATVALLLCGLGAADYGNQVGDVVAALLPTVRHEYRPLPRFILGCCVRHWKHPLRDTLPILLESSREGMESGQVEAAGLSLHIYCMQAYYAGRELQGVARECADYSQAMRRMQHIPSLEHNERVRQSVLNLTSDSAAPWLLQGEAYDERAMASLQAEDNTQIASVFVEKLALASFFQQYGLGLEYLPEAARRLEHIQSLSTTSFYQFHAALVQLGAAATAKGSARRALVRGGKKALGWLERRTRSAPANFLHKAALVRAELHRIEGRDAEALEAYERAIALAAEHDYTNDEALGNELAARFHIERERNTIAHAYLTAARSAYSRWGATAKVRQLDDKFPWLVRAVRSPAAAFIASTPVASTGGSTTAMGEQLDVESVVKASQSLSSMVVLSELIAKLMDIVVENAGAERGFLILRRGGSMMVESYRSIGADRDAAFAPVPLDACRELAASVVHYVTRTKGAVVLGDAARTGNFLGDAYVLRARPKSVIAVPILRNRELDGVLYLENNQSSDAFTPDRVEVLSLLSSQAAISIENATLYEDMESRVRQRTTELAHTNEKLIESIHLLEHTQRELGEASRRAGMADVAATVLHEIGNALNSVTTSIGVARDRVRNARVTPLRRVAELLEHNEANLVEFLTTDDKGKKLPKYLSGVATALGEDQDAVLRELDQLAGTVAQVAETVNAQRVHTTAHMVVERLQVSEVIDEAIEHGRELFDKLGITIVRRFEPLPDVITDRYKLLHVLLNLLANARSNVSGAEITDRRITVSTRLLEATRFAIEIRDAGIGIAPDQLATIFRQRAIAPGSGFELHSASCSVMELDGALTADSPGLGKGITFRLTMRVAPIRRVV